MENVTEAGQPPFIEILGTPVHQVTAAQTLAWVRKVMQEPRLHQIATTNPEFVMAAQKDAAFRDVLWQADLCIPDGVGLLYAARRQGTPLPERVPGSALVYDLAAAAATGGWPLFLLGAAPGVAAQAAQILQQQQPELLIAGTYAGSPAAAENAAIVQRINSSGAQMLFVAYGAPQQDKWIARNREELSSVRLAMGVGGALDFVTGRAARAPQWLQDLHLEWFYRLLREPWRWRRMLALPRFAARTLIVPPRRDA